MPIPQESDSSGTVVQESLRLAARVDSDEDAKPHAAPLFEKRKVLKEKMRDRQDVADTVILAEGRVSTAEAKTDRELVAFGKRLAGRLGTGKLAGEKHETFTTIFDGKAPSALLPQAREGRTAGLQELKKRIEGPGMGVEVKKDAKDLLKTSAAELTAVTARDKAEKVYAAAAKVEEKARLATVVAGRALAGKLQTQFAEEPARARKLLGQGVPGNRKVAKVAPVVRPSLPAPVTEPG